MGCREYQKTGPKHDVVLTEHHLWDPGSPSRIFSWGDDHQNAIFKGRLIKGTG